jgi:GNAT superfamily N-acetyltransferase
MLYPDIVRNEKDLHQILSLQSVNLKNNLPPEYRASQGFLTLQHTLPVLQQMHELLPSIVVRDGDQVVAYALAEVRACRTLMPDLEPMFALLDTLSWKGKPVNDYEYYTVGQICVAEEYRGKGLFEMLYQHHREVYSPKYELFITEISTCNARSIRAHERIGFRELVRHRDHLDEWSAVVWDWS